MKFQIRTLILITAIVAISIAWYADHRRLSIALEESRADAMATRQSLKASESTVQMLVRQVQQLLRVQPSR